MLGRKLSCSFISFVEQVHSTHVDRVWGLFPKGAVILSGGLDNNVQQMARI